MPSVNALFWALGRPCPSTRACASAARHSLDPRARGVLGVPRTSGRNLTDLASFKGVRNAPLVVFFERIVAREPADVAAGRPADIVDLSAGYASPMVVRRASDTVRGSESQLPFSNLDLVL